MNTQNITYFDHAMEELTDYQRIKKAIEFLTTHRNEQPSLDSVAAKVHLSPHHFQRMFKKWAGVTPKKFLQFITLHHAKRLLRRERTLFDVSEETGLSGTGRLHDLFVNIEAMTPGEYKNGGATLHILCNKYESHFGEVVIANTAKGVCSVAFTAADAGEEVRSKYPNAQIKIGVHQWHVEVLSHINGTTRDGLLPLHLKGTSFQLKVWHALLQIPEGQLSTYGELSNVIDSPKASRAVGTAIGANPIAYIIPCHRVIQSTGAIGGYRWGPDRKRLMIGWESAKLAVEI